MNEDELKHWGILNMKWGIRRYQNADGSLTDEGREHYGVGPARATKEKIKSIINDNSKGKRENTSSSGSIKGKIGSVKKRSPEEMSNEELFEKSKRNKVLSNYYNSQNDYLKAQAYNKELKTPKKKTNQFLNNVFVKPLEIVLAKSFEFGLYAAADSFLGLYDSQAADQYMNFVLRSGKKDDGQKDKQNDGQNNNQNNKHNRH